LKNRIKLQTWLKGKKDEKKEMRKDEKKEMKKDEKKCRRNGDMKKGEDSKI
jgi:hypothetical protein